MLCNSGIELNLMKASPSGNRFYFFNFMWKHSTIRQNKIIAGVLQKYFFDSSRNICAELKVRLFFYLPLLYFCYSQKKYWRAKDSRVDKCSRRILGGLINI